MYECRSPRIAIVDYGLGNLFNIKHACQYAGMKADVTSSKDDIFKADAVILPGVGAFGDAMASLKRLDLVDPLKELAEIGKPLIGICLGLQLLLTSSNEFGEHKGLNVIKGKVRRFESPVASDQILKIPQVGWNRISLPVYEKKDCRLEWEDTLLEGIKNNSFMYFVHSYYGVPDNPSVILTETIYGDISFCSSLKYKNIYAFQFHPERSGTNGLKIYENLHSFIKKNIGVANV
jgi:glutamine amidotransferase